VNTADQPAECRWGQEPSALWDEKHNNHLSTQKNLDAADHLLDIVAWHGMQIVLLLGIHTLRAMATGNLTRVDNIFCNKNSASIFVSCGMKPSHRPVKMDHYPVISKIRLTMAHNTLCCGTTSGRQHGRDSWKSHQGS
jgi:hypothetical protein